MSEVPLYSRSIIPMPRWWPCEGGGSSRVRCPWERGLQGLLECKVTPFLGMWCADLGVRGPLLIKYHKQKGRADLKCGPYIQYMSPRLQSSTL